MAEHTETERLDFLIRNGSDIERSSDGFFLKLWLSGCAAQDAGYDSESGFYCAKGSTPRECIDNAIDNKLTFIG